MEVHRFCSLLTVRARRVANSDRPTAAFRVHFCR